jgi:hypothetical protein
MFLFTYTLLPIPCFLSLYYCVSIIYTCTREEEIRHLEELDTERLGGYQNIA